MGVVVDISKWNYPVNFKALVDYGVNGVIIRAGSGNKIDPYCKDYAEKAIECGLDIGFYWFVYLHSGKTITENAVCFEQTIRAFKDKITLKVWCDFEYDTEEKVNEEGVNFTPETRTQLIVDFMNTMKFYGYDCGYYANRDYVVNKLKEKKLAGYPLWYARYMPLYSSAKDDFVKKAFLWQYTNKLNINGNIFDGNKVVEKEMEYYKRITVTEAFKAVGIPCDFESRKKIAEYNGIKDFVGSVAQNAELVKMLADGKLKNPF